jgi:hypothetical protein
MLSSLFLLRYFRYRRALRRRLRWLLQSSQRDTVQLGGPG